MRNERKCDVIYDETIDLMMGAWLHMQWLYVDKWPTKNECNVSLTIFS